jgi:hypothetical protein
MGRKLAAALGGDRTFPGLFFVSSRSLVDSGQFSGLKLLD